MNREETAKRFKKWAQQTIGNHGSDEDAQMFENILTLLEQEPCDDCYSRKSVIDVLTRNGVHFCDLVRITSELKELPPVTPEATECEDIISRILERMWNCRGKHTTSIDKVKMEQIIREYLPSVTPKQRTGRWEWVQYDYNPKIGNWHCSECRCIVVMCVNKEEEGGIPLYKYCPYCGAKMESEEV